MKKFLLFFIFILCGNLFSQENPAIKIGLKDNHYSNITSVLLSKDEKKLITADVSGKILMFNTSDYSYNKTIRESSGIPIESMRLAKNDSILMISQKHQFSDGKVDSLIMISPHDSKILIKENRTISFLGTTKSDVIVSKTSKDYSTATIEFIEQNLKQLFKFQTNKIVSIAEISTDKTKVIYIEEDYTPQKNIIVRDVATTTIIAQIPIAENIIIVHLFFDKDSNNFYAVGFSESKKEIAVYKYSKTINWNKPIFKTSYENYYSDTVVSDIVLNNSHNIILTSNIGSKPLLIKNEGDNFVATNFDINPSGRNKNASHSISLASKNEIIFFRGFNPNFSDIASFCLYDLTKQKIIGEYPKTTNGFYTGNFLPNDNWMVTEQDNSYGENVKFYTAGTFNNRYDKLSIKNYLEINHNIETVITTFFDKKKGIQIFLGKDKSNGEKYGYYKYDLINDKVDRLYDENKNFLVIADYNPKNKMLLLSERGYINQSGTPSRIIIHSDNKNLEYSDTYKFNKFSENGNYLLTINKDNIAEIRELPENKILYSKQLDNGNYDIVTIGESSFGININLIIKKNASNCYTQTLLLSIENDAVSDSMKDCLLITDVSYINENMGMILNNTVVVVNDKPVLFKGFESPKYISFNSDASKFMISCKNGNNIIYETKTFKELARMIHPNEKSHVFLDTKGHYFSNIDAENYLWATKNNTSVSLKSIDKEAFKPEELLSNFGTPNSEYTKILQKAVTIREETKPKATEKTTNNSIPESTDTLGKPNLYLLSIGVSEYKQSNYDLTFADKDALDITQIYGTLNKKEYTAYMDKFFGTTFTIFDKNKVAQKSMNKFLGTYKSSGDLHQIGQDNKWVELNNQKIILWDFNTKTFDSIPIPKSFSIPSYSAGEIFFPTPNSSGFSILGSNNEVMSYDIITKKSNQYKLPSNDYEENKTLIAEDKWLMLNYKHLDSTSTISISIFDGIANKTTQKLQFNPHQYLNRDLDGNTKNVIVENHSSYIIPKLKAVSSNGKYLMYASDEDSLFFVDLTQNNPKPIKISPENVLNYSSKISIAPDGKIFCVLNEKDNTYTTTIFNINGKPIETQIIENKDYAVKGISIKDANPKWVKMFNQLLEDRYFDIEDNKLLNNTKPVSFENVFTANFVNQNADSKNIKNSLLNFFKKAKSNDQVMIFMAGHGMLDTKNSYYFAPHDMDFEKPETNGIAFELIVNSLKNSPAENKLLLLDSCHSGTTLDMNGTNSSSNTSSNSSNNQRGSGAIAVNQKPSFKVSEVISSLFENFLSTSGVTILSASSGSDVAYEYKESGNGAFTASYIASLKEKLNAASILPLDAEKLKWPKSLTNEFITEFFKKVLIATDNKQVPDIREINNAVEIKIW